MDTLNASRMFESLMKVEVKGDKRQKKMMDFISNEFIGNRTGVVPRRVANKLQTRLQMSFYGTQAKVTVNGSDFKASLTNIEQLNEVISNKASKETAKQIELLYEEEFGAIRNVK